MLISLAWKNVWRNKRRSLIIIAAISFGLWGGLLSSAIMMGMGESIVNTAIYRDLSHIQIHQVGYDKDKEIVNFIPNGLEILERSAKVKGVQAVSGRTIIFGMAASPSSTFGVKVVGIDPEKTKQVTDIHKKILEGNHFESGKRNQILVGQKLAKRLNLKIRSKVVLSFAGLDGSIIYIACRVVGIFKTESSIFDETNVFVQQKDLFRILETKPIFHEIAVRAESAKLMLPIQDKLTSIFNNLFIQNWKELAPDIAFLSEMMLQFSFLFVAIILFALVFGITNTMLMSVLDRVRELGVLIAVGMKKSRVFILILLETIFLSLTGGFGGMFIGACTIYFLSLSGIDLSAIATSLESFGSSTMLYPYLPVAIYIILTVMIVLAANIAAIYPAWKAVRLDPAKTIRFY
jgi:ABC-type lipoprotein release transport system permease subunit